MTRLYDPWSSYRSPYHSGGLSGAGEGRGQTDPRRLAACATQGAAPYTHDNTEFDGSFRRPEPIPYGHIAADIRQDTHCDLTETFHLSTPSAASVAASLRGEQCTEERTGSCQSVTGTCR